MERMTLAQVGAWCLRAQETVMVGWMSSSTHASDLGLLFVALPGAR